MGIFGSLFGPNVDGLKQKKDHEGLWKLRESKDWKVRREAMIALAHLGDERGVRYLLAATKPNDAELTSALVVAANRDPRLAAATVRITEAHGYDHATDRVLHVLDTYRAKISPDTIVNDLVNSREGPLWWSQADLKRMLVPFGSRVVTQLIDLLEDLHRARRVVPLIAALGRAAGQAARPLIDAFSTNRSLQAEVEEALLELYDTAAEALLAAQDDPDEQVRALAARVLARLPNHVRHIDGESSHSVREEKTIRERVNAAGARGVAKARDDPSELVRAAVRE